LSKSVGVVCSCGVSFGQDRVADWLAPDAPHKNSDTSFPLSDMSYLFHKRLPDKSMGPTVKTT